MVNETTSDLYIDCYEVLRVLKLKLYQFSPKNHFDDIYDNLEVDRLSDLGWRVLLSANLDQDATEPWDVNFYLGFAMNPEPENEIWQEAVSRILSVPPSFMRLSYFHGHGGNIELVTSGMANCSSLGNEALRRFMACGMILPAVPDGQREIRVRNNKEEAEIFVNNLFHFLKIETNQL